MKHHDFIKCSQDSHYADENSPVNLAMVGQPTRVYDCGTPVIAFGSPHINIWRYDTQEARDTDYQRIMERIGCGVP